MTETSRKGVQANYPPWHQQPLRLTVAEMEEPMLVLRQFFSGYHLPDARACLKEWLDHAAHAKDIHPANYITLYDDILSSHNCYKVSLQ